MTNQRAIDATQTFISLMDEMELHQVWTAMTFLLTAAMKRTPEDKLPEVMQQLMVMVYDQDEGGCCIEPSALH